VLLNIIKRLHTRRLLSKQKYLIRVLAMQAKDGIVTTTEDLKILIKEGIIFFLE
jgi:hypothetical protein